MMTKKKKLMIIIISIVLVLLIGAGSAFFLLWYGEDSPAKRKKKQVVIIKQNSVSSEEPTGDDDDFIYDDDEYYEKIRRELYQKAENNTVKYVQEYKVIAEKWNGPKGYVIVIPEGDKESEKVAQTIKQYFKNQTGIELKIVTDKQKEQKKEILIGNTNRYTSKLKENEYAVKVSGDKLIFEGGHYAMLGKAANWFVSQKYKDGNINVLTGITKDFSATKKGGYKYVWGDEFSGSTLDSSKWSFANRMPGTALMEAVTNKEIPEVASVGQDNLRLRAIRSYRKENPVAQYATNQSLVTMKTMSFMHGYLEMSARVPFMSGCWPSLWLNSAGALGQITGVHPYTVEIDIFENFSSTNTLVPNIHKWRGNNPHSEYNSHHYVDGVKTPATPYVFENTDNLSNEYHIYGFKWTDKELTMSVDGKEYMTFDLTKDFDNKDGMDGYKVPVSILINNYMFAPDVGLFAGASNVNNLDLPYEYDIDWIRLYQIPGQGTLNLAD